MRKRTKILVGVIGGLFLVLAVAGIFVYLDLSSFKDSSVAAARAEEPRFYYYTVASGSSFDKVADDLMAEGGITDATRFKLLGRLEGKTSSIKAGEFEFNTGWTAAQVLEQLVSGRVLLHRVTIPEGLPWWEVGRILERNGFATAADFAACVNDPKLLARYGIPFSTAEGFLFPETYMLNKGRVPTKAHAQSAMQTMVHTFWNKTAALWDEADMAAQLQPGTGAVDVSATGLVVASFVPQYARKHPDEVKRLVILASLVEKESAVPDERPRVAGVYANRLRINMPLQCDPTVIYGLGNKFEGKILRSHLLDASNVYNTYRFYGLPPGPICSPGLQAINAAFKPEVHNYLYFVATGKADGRHIFSRSLAEHNDAVNKYRSELARQRRALHR